MKNSNALNSATYILAESSRLVREDFRRRAQHMSLTQPQWRTLLILSRAPGINQACLASHLEVSPVTVTQSVDRLVKAGLVLRERPENDRRSLNLFLTDSAQPLLAELNIIAEQTREAALAGFNAAERKQLELMLLRVKQNLSDSAAAMDAALQAVSEEKLA